MDTLITSTQRGAIDNMIAVAIRDPKAELEMKVLAGEIQTKDVAERIRKAIQELGESYSEEHRATFAYNDGLRVNVFGADNIFKVCSTGSFRNVPLTVERKTRYFDSSNAVEVEEELTSNAAPGYSSTSSSAIRRNNIDYLDIPELKLRCTLRREEQLRKDFGGSPMDTASHVRVIHRHSWRTGMFRIDLSMVKTKQKYHKTFAEILRQQPTYELEVELLYKQQKDSYGPVPSSHELTELFINTIEPLLIAHQGSPFLLKDSDIKRYRMEWERLKIRFINPITLERRHIVESRPNNILEGYTVTNKADGERCMLTVAGDKRLIRITKPGVITWTGITALKDEHIGDIVDGEFVEQTNTFYIFDVYQYRGKNTMRLPLMTTDEEIQTKPNTSRLGLAHLFIRELTTDFRRTATLRPVHIAVKMFLAGDGAVMEEAIKKMLDTTFEYPTDGLIFTPKNSPVAPIAERKGDSWKTNYKWKPSHQNSIDFLVRLEKNTRYDPLLRKSVVKGTLYVGRNPGSDIIYPCETLTGEYKPPTLPADLQVLAEANDRAPSPFQPSTPKSMNAHEILIPVDNRDVPIDEEGKRIESDTIIECSRDVDNGRWVVMRTRYDKTYQYRVLHQAQFGNDIAVAENIWTNIHNPITEEMLRQVATNPPDDTFEDDLYYRDETGSRDKTYGDVRGFHNKIKEELYRGNIKAGDTLLELAVGRAGDLHKWRKVKPSKVVGIDIFASNLESPRQGACVRYLQEQAKGTKLPPALFIAADMTLPLAEQDNRYIKMLLKQEPAPTEYLANFVGLTQFDVISCQMAIHYACQSEEQFRSFVGNLTTYGKDLFFGTCLDGQSVYALLLGQDGHTFRSGNSTFAEMTKDYTDGDSWTEDFGRAINVKLESFEKPQTEYLVPFGKITQILEENGFKLVNTTMFQDYYSQQNNYTFTGEYQAFSFLHRSFVFKRTAPKKEELPTFTVTRAVSELQSEEVEPETVPEGETTVTRTEEKEPETEQGKELKKKKLTVKIKVEKPKPVLFKHGDTSLDDYKEFSNLHEIPTQIEGIKFPTVEHYYQWAKAKYIGDADAQKVILKTKSGKTAKTEGKKLDEKIEKMEDTNQLKMNWPEKMLEIMYTGVKAKFVQHPELREKLLKTANRPIGEADPRDKFWAIGTSGSTSKAEDPDKWDGQNKLGKILEKIRSELKEQ